VIGLVGAASLAAVDCGGSKPSAPAQATPQASPATATQSPGPVAHATPIPVPPARTPTVAPVDFEQLVELIPDLPGWNRTKPRGIFSSAGIPLSQATAEYSRADSTIKLEILDSGYNNLVLAPLATMLAPTFSERTSTTERKYASIDGAPGFETWLADTNEGDVTVVISGRFVVTARGLNVSGLEPVRALVRAVNLKDLK
jgi:hypothetical protein